MLFTWLVESLLLGLLGLGAALTLGSSAEIMTAIGLIVVSVATGILCVVATAADVDVFAELTSAALASVTALLCSLFLSTAYSLSNPVWAASMWAYAAVVLLVNLALAFSGLRGPSFLCFHRSVLLGFAWPIGMQLLVCTHAHGITPLFAGLFALILLALVCVLLALDQEGIVSMIISPILMLGIMVCALAGARSIPAITVAVVLLLISVAWAVYLLVVRLGGQASLPPPTTTENYVPSAPPGPLPSNTNLAESPSLHQNVEHTNTTNAVGTRNENALSRLLGRHVLLAQNVTKEKVR